MREVGRPEARWGRAAGALGDGDGRMGAMRPMPMGMGACGWDGERVRVGLGRLGFGGGWTREWALGREVRWLWLVWAVVIREYRGKIPS